MCGIVGYNGTVQAAPLLLEGLSKLEYRGYDSAGLAVVNDKTGNIDIVKAKGRLKILAEKTDDGRAMQGTIGPDGQPTESRPSPMHIRITAMTGRWSWFTTGSLRTMYS